MRRGTRVGQAYVQITADGSGINDDIADAVEDVDYKKIADKHGKDYSKALEKRLGKDLRSMFRETLGNLQRAIDTDDSINKSVEKILTVNDKNGRLTRAYREVAKRAGVEFTGEFNDVVRASLQRSLRKTLQEAARSGNLKGVLENLKIDGEGNEGGLLPGKALEDAVRRVKKASKQMQRDAEQGLKDQQAFLQKFEEARVRLREKSNDAILKDDEDLRKAQQKLFRDLAKQAEKEDERLWSIRRATAKAHAQYLADLERQRIRDEAAADREREKTRGLSGIGDRTSRLFGGESRIGPLRLLGKTIGGLINITEKFGRVSISAGQALIGGFSKGVAEAGENASRFQKLLGGLSGTASVAGKGISSAFSSLAASGPALAVAIPVVLVALSALVSVLGSLLAMVTALTGAIVSGLTGALFVLGGAFTTAAAAGGLLAIAFTSMTDAQKALLKDAFYPLKEVLTGLGQVMLVDMIEKTKGFTTWANNLRAALMLLVPVAEVMGAAFGRAGNILTNSLSGPGFVNFTRALATYLPTIVANLSRALGGFLNGVLGMFAAIMPHITQFSRYLSDVATRFSKWANSAQGQNSIVDFTDRALESLESLWNFTKQFFGYLGDVFFSPVTQKAGNTMFDNLASSFAGFRRAFARAAADGSLERWFNDAIKFASDLSGFIKGVKDTFVALYNSGVLQAVGAALFFMGSSMSYSAKIIGPLVDAIGSLITPLKLVNNFVVGLTESFRTLFGMQSQLNGSITRNAFSSLGPATPPKGLNPFGASNFGSSPNVAGLGAAALAGTNVKAGGTKGPWKNPYTAYANSLIKDGPSTVAQIKAAMVALNKQVADAIKEATRSSDAIGVRTAMSDMANQIREGARNAVETAQSALNSAAQSLASASNRSEARRALAEVRKAQRDLAKVMRDQDRLFAVAARVRAQGVITGSNVQNLVAGFKVQNATLADLAAARDKVATKLEAARDKLIDAIALRDDYAKTVSDATKSFGSLVSAQAQMLNGVEQALTATDVTSNLQSRLEQIQTFQNNLRLLLAQGLSNDAYKQLVDAGVEGGGATAQALVNGGASAISDTNFLVDEINKASTALGSAASTRMYQAGVDAARGLVAGLTSLSAELDAAATKLGNSIAAAVARSLGIRSPSTRMFAMMDGVGDGTVNGLDAQHAKVGAAAARFADQIAVSPEVASYAAQQGSAPTVSGNGGSDQKFRDLVVVTPTEDPEAVAMEVLNEVTGRL